MKLNAANYYSYEANMTFVSASQYNAFTGTLGHGGCEARELAILKGEIAQEDTTALLVGSYVDAHFSGELDKFMFQHPEIFLKTGPNKGMLKADFQRASVMIQRAERDELFMSYMDGTKQKIMTGEIGGVPVKVKLDVFKDTKEIKRIVDLKTVRSIQEVKYVRDLESRLNFIEIWGYDTQLAIYREIARQNTGKDYPCFIAAISKEEHPDIEIIQIPDKLMDAKIETVARNIKRIQDIKEGLIEPDRCGNCGYCRDTKKLERPIMMDELTGDVFTW